MSAPKLDAVCTWCNEPTEDHCHELHGRTGGLDSIGRAPLCGFCETVNEYLWTRNRVPA